MKSTTYEGRDPARIDVLLAELECAWRANPDLRLGQLVVNAAGVADPFNVEDQVMLAGLLHFRNHKQNQ